MKKFGLIGEHLPHSYSPQIHSKFGDYPYDLCEVEEPALEALLADETYGGFNVTIPYKKKVFALCDEVSEQAKAIGSVNTVVRGEDGKLKGYNTDYFGFVYLLKDAGIDVVDKKCIVLGSGGASLTTQAVLRDLGAGEIVVISRSGENNYENIAEHFDAEIIVNTTPVGMYPNNGRSPINLDDFHQCSGVVDLIYNPYRTKLILDAMAKSIPCAGGLAMLVAQAKQASELFQDITIEDEVIDSAFDEVKREMLNIILIGMPGSGKTTVGMDIARSMGRRFIDIDEMIVDFEGGLSIPEIFAQKGEDHFRRVETKMLSEACKESGFVIATGGGIVKKKLNYNVIKQNGVVIWVKRDLAKLATEGRPLSQSTSIAQLYEERKDAYAYWSDYFINNNEERD